MANVSSSNGIEKYPKLRFPEFTEPWSHIKLSDFTERVMRKNKNNETNLPLTISSKDGLVDQVTFFNKTVALLNLKLKELTRYIMLIPIQVKLKGIGLKMIRHHHVRTTLNLLQEQEEPTKV